MRRWSSMPPEQEGSAARANPSTALVKREDAIEQVATDENGNAIKPRPRTETLDEISTNLQLKILDKELQIEDARHKRAATDLAASRKHELAVARMAERVEAGRHGRKLAARKQIADISISSASLAAGVALVTQGFIVMGGFCIGGGLCFTAYNYVKHWFGFGVGESSGTSNASSEDEAT